MAGTLFLVGTPIGNLGDITLRAIETLKAAERIYAEDTRRTRALLSHLGIAGKKLLALHAHSSERVVRTAVEILEEGIDVALVTDAGMPSVSDPGAELVRAATEAGLSVTVVPGPSAVTTAVALSGLVDGAFSFLGFLPRKGGRRRDALETIAQSPIPVVLFEAPSRLHATLTDLHEACGAERRAVVARELTKRFEEAVRGTLSELADPDEHPAESWKGEATVVIEGSRADSAANAFSEEDLDERIRALLDEGHSVRDVVEELLPSLKRHSVSKRDLYARCQLLADSRDSDDPMEDASIDDGSVREADEP